MTDTNIPPAPPTLGGASLQPMQVAAVATAAAPSLSDALRSIADPVARALIEKALAAAQGPTMIDPDARPPVLLWLDGAEAMVATAWKPPAAAYGDRDEPSTYRGILAVAAAQWQGLPMRQGRSWGYWHGRAAPMVAACKVLQSLGWRVIRVMSLQAAEAKADAELAVAPRVPAKGKGAKTRGAKALPGAAHGPEPVDLTGFETA